MKRELLRVAVSTVIAVALFFGTMSIARSQSSEVLNVPADGASAVVDPPAAKPAAPAAVKAPTVPTFHLERQCFVDRLGRTRCAVVTVQDDPGTAATMAAPMLCPSCPGGVAYSYSSAPTFAYSAPMTTCATCSTTLTADAVGVVAGVMSRHDARVANRIARRTARRGG